MGGGRRKVIKFQWVHQKLEYFLYLKPFYRFLQKKACMPIGRRYKLFFIGFSVMFRPSSSPDHNSSSRGGGSISKNSIFYWAFKLQAGNFLSIKLEAIKNLRGLKEVVI